MYCCYILACSDCGLFVALILSNPVHLRPGVLVIRDPSAMHLRAGVKIEERSTDIGFQRSGSHGSIATGHGFNYFLKSILTSRSPSEIVKLSKVLAKHGITESISFQVLSKDIIERKLSSDLGLGELADVLEVWTAVQKCSKDSGKCSRNGFTSKGSRKGSGEGSTRGRSRSARGCRRDRDRSYSTRSCSTRVSAVSSSVHDEQLSLWTATIENKVAEVKRLVRHGVSMEMRHQSWTPLMAACERGFFTIASFLLENSADTSAVNRKGRCALSFAAAPSKDNCRQEQRVSSLDIIKLLVTHRAIIDREDRWGRTPREYAEAASKAVLTSDPSLQRARAAKLLLEFEQRLSYR